MNIRRPGRRYSGTPLGPLALLVLLACPAAPADGSTETGTAETGAAAPLPNIDLSATAELVASSMWTTTEGFDPDHCAVVEGCVEASGERRLLRFSTYTPNVGTADFVVGSPEIEPERFVWGECHGHWHVPDYAVYRLLGEGGEVVALGHKMAFALFDLAPWLLDAGPAKYPLDDGTQGISVGWVDAYLSQLDCQWVDVTGLASGDYTLEITVNPDARVAESDMLDNRLLIPVSLTDVDSGPPGVPAAWTCETMAYGGNGTCDCGCGAFDPNCTNPTLAACEQCNLPGSCAEGEAGCAAIAANDNSSCE